MPSSVGLTFKMKTKKAPLVVEPFDVVIPHVEITLRHFRREVDYFHQNTPFIVSRLGGNCLSFLRSLIWHSESGGSLHSHVDREGVNGVGFQIFVSGELRGKSDLVKSSRNGSRNRCC